MPQLRQELLLDRPDLERGKMTQGVYDLIEQVTIASPINDLLHGNASLKREALAYLRQEGLYKRAPFTPPEWITECLNAMTSEEMEQLQKCRTNHEAYIFLDDYRHRRRLAMARRPEPQPKARPMKKRGPKINDQTERLRLASGMTPQQFAAHFHITVQATYIWNERNGRPLRKKTYARRKG